jgi:hypothetical protein
MAKPKTLSPEIILLIGNILLKYGPAVARQIKALFEKDDPTVEDWEAVFALAEKSYDDYVGPRPPVAGGGKK